MFDVQLDKMYKLIDLQLNRMQEVAAHDQVVSGPRAATLSISWLTSIEIPRAVRRSWELRVRLQTTAEQIYSRATQCICAALENRDHKLSVRHVLST